MTEELKTPSKDAEVVEPVKEVKFADENVIESSAPEKTDGAQQKPDPNKQLTIEEIMRSAQLAQAEAEKFTIISNTLLKCGLVVQSILKQNTNAKEEATGGVSENPPAK